MVGPIADSPVRLDSEYRVAGLVEKSEELAWLHNLRMNSAPQEIEALDEL